MMGTLIRRPQHCDKPPQKTESIWAMGGFGTPTYVVQDNDQTYVTDSIGTAFSQNVSPHIGFAYKDGRLYVADTSHERISVHERPMRHDVNSTHFTCEEVSQIALQTSMRHSRQTNACLRFVLSMMRRLSNMDALPPDERLDPMETHAHVARLADELHERGRCLFTLMTENLDAHNIIRFATSGIMLSLDLPKATEYPTGNDTIALTSRHQTMLFCDERERLVLCDVGQMIVTNEDAIASMVRSANARRHRAYPAGCLMFGIRRGIAGSAWQPRSRQDLTNTVITTDKTSSLTDTLSCDLDDRRLPLMIWDIAEQATDPKERSPAWP